MRSVILHEPLRLSVQQREVPEPGRGEILIRVKCATTCGTDLKAYLRGHPQIPMPGPFGHEYSGEVAALGPETNSFHVGDSVMGVHSAPCGACYWCTRGQENLCKDVMRTKVLGSFAEYLLLPANIVRTNLYPKPPELCFKRAALLEPLACVANALERIHAREDDSILLIGSGAVAILFRAAFAKQGIHNVWIAGRNRDRLRLLADQGAQTVHLSELESIRNKATQGRGFDVVIECAGDIGSWELALEFVRRGGVAVLFGGCPSGSKVPFDTGRIHYDDITIISPFHFGPKAVRAARDWLLDPSFDPGPLITSEAKLEDAPTVFEDLRNGRAIKVAFTP